MLQWLLKFLCCALVIIVVVYVVNLLLAEFRLPRVADILIMLIVAVGMLLFVVRYLGWPPDSGP